MSDFLTELGHLGMIARLKRMSDAMLYSIREVYKTENVDIEPNWHLVFLLLKKYRTRTMSEIAEAFGLSQPAVVKIINKMKHKGYIEVVADAADSRKKQLRLSGKALEELPRFERIWAAGQASIGELLDGNDAFMPILADMEQQLSDISFSQRIRAHLKDRK